MKTICMAICDIRPADYNPRVELQEEDAEYKALLSSIAQHGLVVPLIVNKRDGLLISGHQRLNVLKQMGVAETEVVEVDLDEAQAKALCIGLNKLDGSWDYGALLTLINEMLAAHEDLTDTGFTGPEVKHLMADLEDAMEVEYPEEAEMPEDTETVKCVIGEYDFTITMQEYDDLTADLRIKDGFGRDTLLEGFKRRITRQ